MWIAVSILVGALVSVVAVYLYFVATGDDLDATGMRMDDEEAGHEEGEGRK